MPPLSPPAPISRGRVAAVFVVLVFSGWVYRAIQPEPPPEDFVEYWSAGVAALRGQNPYDPDVLRPLQRAAGSAKPDVVMMWNPPWILPLIAPLGWLSPAAAQRAWVEVQVLAVLFSSAVLWTVYGGPPGKWWVPVALAVSAPLNMLIVFGHLTGFCLLGLTGFLYFHVRGRPAAAGACAALTALKPHLLFAFGVVLVLDGLATRRGRIALAAGVGVIAAAGVVAAVMNPDIYRMYAAGLRADSAGVHVHPTECMLPIASFWLRHWVAPDQFWVQMLPTVVAAVAVAAYWFPRRRTWDWSANAPGLVFVSVLAIGYGSWLFDLVVLMVPVVAAAVRFFPDFPDAGRTFAGLYALLNVGTVVIPLYLRSDGEPFLLHWYIYFAPAVLGLYLLAVRATRP